MLIDGNAQVLAQAAKRLTSQPVSITLFLYTNPRDALKFAIYHSIDVVYARQTLPEMTGAVVANEIRRFHPHVQYHILQDGKELPSFLFLKPKEPIARKVRQNDL